MSDTETQATLLPPLVVSFRWKTSRSGTPSTAATLSWPGVRVGPTMLVHRRVYGAALTPEH